MEPIHLEPSYSTAQIPGRCLKCLAEKQLDSCLRILLVGEDENMEIQEKYATLLSFLQSPESKNLRDEAERFLSAGKEVRVKIDYTDGKPRYALEVE